jgi:hypothetical protein
MSGNATIDRAADFLEITDTSAAVSYKATPNFILGLTSAPVGINDSQVLTNKTLGNTNTITLKDTLFTLQDDADVTKQAQFQLSGNTTGTTRTYALPNASVTLASLTGTETLTNKTLTAPVINNGSITGTTITTDAIVGQAASTTGTVYGVSITTGTISSAGLASGAVTFSKVATGFPVQTVNALTTAVATGTTVIPNDDTIPQITEGDQYMTLAITPKSATNTLVIQATANFSSSVINNLTTALFQDATASALAATLTRADTATASYGTTLVHTMTAGTTSSTTFRVRIGGSAAGTTTFNGTSGVRIFGAITKSSMVITEVAV